jgi:hypothetical protein
MKVGILRSGDVAKALAGGFLKHGHCRHDGDAHASQTNGLE